MSELRTISEIADRLHVGTEQARGLVSILAAFSLVRERGVRRSETRRGRGAVIWELIENYEDKFIELLKAARL